MNRDDIIRMARESGAKDWQKINSDVEYLMSADALKEFAALVAAAQRQWVGLTDEDIMPLCRQAWVFTTVKQWAEIIEAKLREKNGGAA